MAFWDVNHKSVLHRCTRLSCLTKVNANRCTPYMHTHGIYAVHTHAGACQPDNLALPTYVRAAPHQQPTRDLRGQTEPKPKGGKATCARPRASAYVHIVALARTCAPHVGIGNKSGSDGLARRSTNPIPNTTTPHTQAQACVEVAVAEPGLFCALTRCSCCLSPECKCQR